MRIGQTGIQHKTGGPDMVISDFDDLSVVTEEEQMVSVRWWDEKEGVFKRDKFNRSELRDIHSNELKP